MLLDKKLRNLAKTAYWQNLYYTSKNNSGIHLFENVNNFSSTQLRFLYWLSTYSKLYEELDTFACDLLTEKVIEDFDRTDAYLIYKHKHIQYEWKQYRLQEKNSKRTTKKHLKGNITPIDVSLRSE